MANKEIKKPEKVKLKLGDTKASQDITGGQLEENKALEKEVMKKLDSLLPYSEEKKRADVVGYKGDKVDMHDLPPVAQELYNGAKYEQDEASASKNFPQWSKHVSHGLVDLAMVPVGAVIDGVGSVGNKAVNGYKRVYNYISNLINNKKLDEANELIDAIIEMNSARDLSDKQNKNG